MSKQTSIEMFEILSKLGEGAFGSVYKIKRKENGKIYAMKKVKMQKLSSKEKEQALNEVRILASINNNYVIKYKDSFFEESTSELCIVMEFADKGDLQGLINQTKKANTLIDEEKIWMYAAQILSALKHLHDLNILHRDLKGANIFLADNGNSVKLGDLNVSKVAKKNFVYTQTGTPYYLSPEVWRGEPYNSKCDIWSLGCCIYELAVLSPPFTANSLEDLYKKVLKGAYAKLPAKYSNDLSKFIQVCLTISPKNRASVAELMSNPRILPYVKVDVQAEKAQLLKTMKLPYGGLNQLKNILPKPQYEEQKSDQQQQTSSSSQQSSQNSQQALQQIAQQQQQRGVRSSSSNPDQQYERPQSARGGGGGNQPKQFYQAPGFQQAPGTPKGKPSISNEQQRQNSRLSSAQNGSSKRHSSQEKLMQNYNNNNYYNQNYKNNVDASGRPPVSNQQNNQNNNRPPMNPQRPAGLASNIVPQQQPVKKNFY